MKFLLLGSLIAILGAAVVADVDPNTDKVTCSAALALVQCWPQCYAYNKGIPNCCKLNWFNFECTCVPVAGDAQTLSTADMLKAQFKCGVDSILGFFTNTHNVESVVDTKKRSLNK